jgi:aminoglycoside 6'-N-acetyltransferase I
MNHIRTLKESDRSEWLRMLMLLYPQSTESDHTSSVDAFLTGKVVDSLLPAVVFVSARLNGRLSGFLELSIRNYAEGCLGTTPYVESWYVDRDVRGSGIGRRLVAAAEDWARAQGYRELASDAELSNTASHDAHRAVGFTEVERIVVFRKDLP